MTNWGQANSADLVRLINSGAEFQLSSMSVQEKEMMEKLYAHNKSTIFNLDFPSIGLRDTSAFKDINRTEESSALNDLIKLKSGRFSI
jgi:hypothetical protein